MQLWACQVSPMSGGTDRQASATPYTLQRWQSIGDVLRSGKEGDGK